MARRIPARLIACRFHSGGRQPHWRPARRGVFRRLGRFADVIENLLHGVRLVDEGDDAHPGKPAGKPRRSAPAASPTDSALRRGGEAEEKIGTGHGERLYAPTQPIEFHRAATTPAEVITLDYDSRANLVARDVIPRYAKMPKAFPGDGFVPDPS